MKKKYFSKSYAELDNKTLRKLILTVFLGFFILMLLFDLAFESIGIRNKRIQDIDDLAYTQVFFSDGTTTTVQSSSFPQIHHGERAIVHIPVKELNAHSGDQICFVFYNSVVRAFSNSHMLYSNGDTASLHGKLAGNVFCRIPINASTLNSGMEILIEIKPQQYTSISRLIHLRLMPLEEASLYPLINHELDFMLFSSILVFSSFVLGLLAILFPFGLRSSKALSLATFCLSVSCWYLGYNSMLYILSDNNYVCSQIEYPALYFAPIPLFIYFYLSAAEKYSKRTYGVVSIASGLLFVSATLLDIYSTDWNYNRLLPVLHVTICISVLILFFTFLKTGKKRTGISDQIMNIGVAVFAILVTLQIAEIQIFRTNHAEISSLNTSYSTVALLIFVGALFLNSVIKYFESQRILFVQHQLETMAYTDILTGIHSRTGCYRELEAIDQEHITDFTILFIDANNLKLANDHYGHETGDRLICFIANSIKNAFYANGFYGRWGGDEFIVCFRDSDKVSGFLKKFFDILETAENDFEFPVTVAVGRATSTSEHPLTTNEAINEADAAMYENKKKRKAACEKAEEEKV